MKTIYCEFDEEREYGIAIFDNIIFDRIVGAFVSRISLLLFDKR